MFTKKAFYVNKFKDQRSSNRLPLSPPRMPNIQKRTNLRAQNGNSQSDEKGHIFVYKGLVPRQNNNENGNEYIHVHNNFIYHCDSEGTC